MVTDVRTTRGLGGAHVAQRHGGDEDKMPYFGSHPDDRLDISSLFRYADARKQVAPDHPADRQARRERKRKRDHRRRMKRRGAR